MTGRRRGGGPDHTTRVHTDQGPAHHPQPGDGPDGPARTQQEGPGRLGTDVDAIETMAGRLDSTRSRIEGVGNTVRSVNVGPQSMGVVGSGFTGAAQAHVRTAEEHLARTTQAVEQAQRGTHGTARAYRDTDATSAASLDAIDTTSTPPATHPQSSSAGGGGEQPPSGPPSAPPGGGDGPPPREPGGGWHGDDGLHLTPGQNRAADDFLARARQAEPGITDSMRRISDSVPGSELVGLDYRLKTDDSFKRKLATAIADNPDLSISEHLADMKDSVRYTMRVDEGGYTGAVQHAVQTLVDQGYQPVKFKNTWGGDGYQGINSMWRDPSTGHVFEVQFHTGSSFDAKMVTHDLYEQARLPGVDERTRMALDRQQAEIFGQVPVPPGATEITVPKGGSDRERASGHLLRAPGRGPDQGEPVRHRPAGARRGSRRREFPPGSDLAADRVPAALLPGPQRHRSRGDQRGRGERGDQSLAGEVGHRERAGTGGRVGTGRARTHQKIR